MRVMIRHIGEFVSDGPANKALRQATKASKWNQRFQKFGKGSNDPRQSYHNLYTKYESKIL